MLLAKSAEADPQFRKSSYQIPTRNLIVELPAPLTRLGDPRATTSNLVDTRGSLKFSFFLSFFIIIASWNENEMILFAGEER